jgi:hypothetical protein
VAYDVYRPASLVAQIQVPVVQARRTRARCERGEELLRKEVLVDVDARYLPIMRVRRLRSESPGLNVVIAYQDMVLPPRR